MPKSEQTNVSQHPASKLVVMFQWDRDTKGTHRYAEQGNADDHKIGTLYIKKSVFQGRQRPDQLTITIE